MTSRDQAAEIVAARAALYNTQDTLVAPGGIAPRWGCALIAHERLGWCGSCRGVDTVVEAMGWRLWASGHHQDIDWARAVTRERGQV